MSNATNKLSTANRAMLVGAIAGGSASLAKHWQQHKSGQLDTNTLAAEAAKDAIKAGAIAGSTTYVAEKMAGRPALSLLTILSVGAAGLYLLDQTSEHKNEQ